LTILSGKRLTYARVFQLVDEPEDFDAFWAAARCESERIPLSLDSRALTTELRHLRVFEAELTGFDGEAIPALLVRPPAGDEPAPCIVEFVGYSATTGHPLDNLAWASAGYVHLLVEPRTPGRALEGIASPGTYWYRRVFLNAARAVRTMALRPEVDAGRVVVAGASQGAAIALAAAALTPVAAVLADVPYGADHPCGLREAAVGPFREIAEHLEEHPEQAAAALATLAYFDGLHFAARAAAPALFSVALEDTTCPPATAYALRDGYAGPAELQEWPGAGHAGGGAEQRALALAFLRRVLALKGPHV
jgi:cephalosporin-C deacetylase